MVRTFPRTGVAYRWFEGRLQVGSFQDMDADVSDLAPDLLLFVAQLRAEDQKPTEATTFRIPLGGQVSDVSVRYGAQTTPVPAHGNTFTAREPLVSPFHDLYAPGTR